MHQYNTLHQYRPIHTYIRTSLHQYRPIHTYIRTSLHQYRPAHVLQPIPVDSRISAPVGIRQYSECNRQVSPDRQATIISLSGITLRTVRLCLHTHRLFIYPFIFPQTGLPAVKIFYHCKLHITI